MIHFVWRYGIIDSELMSCQTLKMLSHFRRIDTFMEGLERLRVVCRYAFTITRPPTRQTLKMLSHFRCRFSFTYIKNRVDHLGAIITDLNSALRLSLYFHNHTTTNSPNVENAVAFSVQIQLITVSKNRNDKSRSYFLVRATGLEPARLPTSS